MFSPLSWRDIDIADIDLAGMSNYELQRSAAYVSVAGYFDNYRLGAHIYTNGTYKQVR